MTAAAPGPVGGGDSFSVGAGPVGTGRLRNGNPPGDLRLARRCGARTREGHSCRQPAMKNCRCRLHGGKSTGPRTAEGLARSRRARWVHGGRGREYAALRRDGMAIRRRINVLCAEIAARAAFDGGGSVQGARKEFSSPLRGGGLRWGGSLEKGGAEAPEKLFCRLSASSPPPATPTRGGGDN